MRLWFGIGTISVAAMLGACGEDSPTGASAEAALAVETSGRGDNLPPRISSVRFDPAEPVADEAVRAVVDAVDADGDPVKLVYEWRLNGHPVGAGTQRLTLDGASRGDEFQVSVVASDGRAESEPFQVRAQVANRPPRVERLSIEPATQLTAGMTLVIRPEGSDPDGDTLTFEYAWVLNGEPMDHTGATLDTRSLERGDVLQVAVRAHDGLDPSEPLSAPDFRIINSPPRVVSTPGRSALGGGFHYRVEAEDPDGDTPLRFELEDPPAGMKIGAVSGEIDWRPTGDQAGRHTVRVIVDDLKGGRIAHAFDVNVAAHTAQADEPGT